MKTNTSNYTSQHCFHIMIRLFICFHIMIRQFICFDNSCFIAKRYINENMENGYIENTPFSNTYSKLRKDLL